MTTPLESIRGSNTVTPAMKASGSNNKNRNVDITVDDSKQPSSGTLNPVVLMNCLDDSDSDPDSDDDDDLLFGNGSVFDKNYQWGISKKKPSKGDGKREENRSRLGNSFCAESVPDRKVASIPELPRSAEMTPKDSRAKQEGIDLTLSDSPMLVELNHLFTRDPKTAAEQSAKAKQETLQQSAEIITPTNDSSKANQENQRIDLTLSDSEDDDDDDMMLFGNGSVFDKNYQCKSSKKALTEKAKVKPEATRSSNLKAETPVVNTKTNVKPEENRSNNRKAENPVVDAKVNPKPEEIRSNNRKAENLVVDTKANVKPEEIRSNSRNVDILMMDAMANVKPEGDTERLKRERDESPLMTAKKEEAPKPPPETIKTPEQVQEERRLHLNAIQHPGDRALQLLLWEVGFTYNVYAHQFDAVRFVAGLKSTFPYSAKAKPGRDEDTPVGARLRSEMLRQAAKEFISRENGNDPPEYGWSHILPTKGMLLADEMGLGKTIEALAGAALRNAMLSYDRENSELPTLIVSPQDGIQNQWYETLVKSGVNPSHIVVWGESKIQTKRRQFQYLRNTCRQNSEGYTKVDPKDKGQNQSYILCTRYNIQSELRKLFQFISTALGASKDRNVLRTMEKRLIDLQETTLFREIAIVLIGKLQNQYQANKGKAKNRFIHEKEKIQDCVARLIRSRRNAEQPHFTFQTIIVDEAHFCKNVLAYWGLGLALLGTKTRRTVLLTGTPYNNGPSDMTALMTFIDPSHDAAEIDWWEKAVSSTGNGALHHLDAVDDVSLWRETYLLRRTKDVLLQKLPPRIKTEIDVAAIPSELWIYEAYEGNFLSCLRKLRNNMEATSPEARHRAKKVFEVMMACMACMRMALVHPLLPGGREMTIQFSPSRRHLLKREERPHKCVFCNSDPTKAAEAAARRKENREGSNPQPQSHDSDNEDNEIRALAGSARADMDLDDDQLDDDDFEDDYEAKSKKERELEEKKKGPIVPLGPEFCLASGTSCQHFAHEKCIEKHRKSMIFTCPRCHDLKNRVHGKLSHNVYCKEVTTHIDETDTGGFTASAKIEKAINWFQTTVPQNEKAIFLSFFKGSLDLIEGILVSKFGIDCARYDGDVSKEARTSDLQRFKTSNTCRVLLATVQSGGTGLNITEANHVCFLDRWFNPCVHDQAESRCHRIGQKKKVNVAYLDINFTIDIVMKRINVLKEGNASVILADGTSLGDRWSLGYRNVSGVIGETMKALQAMREHTISSNGDQPLPPYNESDLEENLAKAKEQSNVKKEIERKFRPEGEKPATTPVDLSMFQGRAWESYLEAKKSGEAPQLPLHTQVFSDSTNTKVGYGSTSSVGYTNSMPPSSATLNPATRPDKKVLIQHPHSNFRFKKVPPTSSARNILPTATTVPFLTSSARASTYNNNAQKSSWTKTLKKLPPAISRRNSSLRGSKRSAPMPKAPHQTPPTKKGRFALGLSLINSKKRSLQESMRRKRRGDL